MEHAFQADCQVTGTAEPTKFTAFISKDWSVGDAPNGGYLMALAINAARKATLFRDPLSMTAYYLNKTIENAPVDIEVKVLNETKSMVTTSISLSQQGVLRSQYMGTLGSLSKQTGVNYNNLPLAPQLPHPDDCVDISAVIRDTYGEKMPFAHRIQYKAPKDDPFVIGAIDKKEVRLVRVSPHMLLELFLYSEVPIFTSYTILVFTEQSCQHVLLDSIRWGRAVAWPSLHGSVLRRHGAHSRHDAVHLGAHARVHGALLAAP